MRDRRSVFATASGEAFGRPGNQTLGAMGTAAAMRRQPCGVSHAESAEAEAGEDLGGVEGSEEESRGDEVGMSMDGDANHGNLNPSEEDYQEVVDDILSGREPLGAEEEGDGHGTNGTDAAPYVGNEDEEERLVAEEEAIFAQYEAMPGLVDLLNLALPSGFPAPPSPRPDDRGGAEDDLTKEIFSGAPLGLTKQQFVYKILSIKREGGVTDTALDKILSFFADCILPSGHRAPRSLYLSRRVLKVASPATCEWHLCEHGRCSFPPVGPEGYDGHAMEGCTCSALPTRFKKDDKGRLSPHKV